MDDVARLLAEREIERMILDYAAWNDAGAWDKVAALYTDDGRMSRPTAPDDFIVGRAAILDAFQARPPRTTRHVCANIRVSMETTDTARAVSQILLFTAAAQPPLVGSYHDRLERTTSGWLFTERRGSLDFPAT